MAESFIFYETVFKQLECLDADLQLKFYKAITKYGLYNKEPNFTGLELSIWIPMQAGIDNAKARRLKTAEDGKKGGRPEIPQAIKTAILEDLHAGIAQKEIAVKYGIAQSSVSNIKNLNDNANDNVNANDNDNHIPPEISGGEDADAFSTPKPDNIPEPTTPAETPHEIPDSTLSVPTEYADTTASTPRQNPKPKKPPLREREPVNDYETVEKAYLQSWDSLYEAGAVHTAEPVVNWRQSRKLLQGHFKTLSAAAIAQAVKTAAKDSFILEGGYSLTTILSSSVLNRLINAHYKPPEQKQTQYRRSAAIASDTMQEGDYL